MNPTAKIEISIIPQKICSHFPPRKRKKKVLNNISFQFIKGEFIVSILLFLGVYRICTSSPESFKKPTLSWCVNLPSSELPLEGPSLYTVFSQELPGFTWNSNRQSPLLDIGSGQSSQLQLLEPKPRRECQGSITE